MKNFFLLLFFIQGCSDKRRVEPPVPNWYTKTETLSNNSALSTLIGTQDFLNSNLTEESLCTGLASPVLFNCQERFFKRALSRLKSLLQSSANFSRKAQLSPGNISSADSRPLFFNDKTVLDYPLEILDVSTSEFSAIAFEPQKFEETLGLFPFYNFTAQPNFLSFGFDVEEIPSVVSNQLTEFQHFNTDGKIRITIDYESETAWSLGYWAYDLSCTESLSRSPKSEFISLKLESGILKSQYSAFILGGASGLPTSLVAPPSCSSVPFKNRLPTSNDFLVRIEAKTNSLASHYQFFLVPGDQILTLANRVDHEFSDSCDRFAWDCAAASLDLSTLDNPACFNHQTQTFNWADDCSSVDTELSQASFLDFSFGKSANELTSGPTLDLENSTEILNGL